MYSKDRPATPCRWVSEEEPGPGIFFEDVQPQIPKCPICTDQCSNVVTLECGHLVTTPDPDKSTANEPSMEKRNIRGNLGRWVRNTGGARTPALVPPPEVVVHRAELYKRAPPTAMTSATKVHPQPRPKKKKEPELPLEPDIREDGRLLGSKVLPIMALLLQRKADGEDDDGSEDKQQNMESAQEDNSLAEQEKKTGKRKLTIQCVQLLPDAEPARPKTGCRRSWKKESSSK